VLRPRNRICPFGEHAHVVTISTVELFHLIRIRLNARRRIQDLHPRLRLQPIPIQHNKTRRLLLHIPPLDASILQLLRVPDGICGRWRSQRRIRRSPYFAIRTVRRTACRREPRPLLDGDRPTKRAGNPRYYLFTPAIYPTLPLLPPWHPRARWSQTVV